jgi:hypothetical protein
MNRSNTCDSPQDVGYLNVCHICGTPQDAGYFDVASIKAAPPVGEEVELARYQLNPQYCGTLLYFMQYAEESTTKKQMLSNTPGYEWLILCNNQPRAPYLPTSLILNPWGYNSLPIHLRLEEGCTLRFIVRRVAATVSQELSQVGGRLLGRSWYNTIYGGVPNRL